MAAYTTIDDPELYFQIKLYTGTGSELAITLPGSEDMQPDLIWNKERSGTEGQNWTDSVRGVTKYVMSNNNDDEVTNAESVKSFNSDGFTLGTFDGMNTSSETYVAWCWKESATAGFDIVAYTGTGSAHTESHSLSAVPHFFITKTISAGSQEWFVYHHKNTAAPETEQIFLNETGGTNDSAAYLNDTAPTSSVFTVGTAGPTNRSSTDMIGYLFSEKQGFSKFGGYTGNGNADGTFVYTGFKPAYVLIKRTDGTGSWFLFDNKRLGYNAANYRLYADAGTAEDTTVMIDLLSNGFKHRTNDGETNGSGRTFVYMAFAKAPLVNSNGVPCNAR